MTVKAAFFIDKNPSQITNSTPISDLILKDVIISFIFTDISNKFGNINVSDHNDHITKYMHEVLYVSDGFKYFLAKSADIAKAAFNESLQHINECNQELYNNYLECND